MQVYSYDLEWVNGSGHLYSDSYEDQMKFQLLTVRIVNHLNEKCNLK